MRLHWSALFLLVAYVVGCESTTKKHIRTADTKTHIQTPDTKELRSYAEESWKPCPECADPGQVPEEIKRRLEEELTNPRLRYLLTKGRGLNATTTQEEGLQVLQAALTESRAAVVSPATTLDTLLRSPLASKLTQRERSTAQLKLGRLLHQGAPGVFTRRIEAVLQPVIQANAASVEPVRLFVEELIHRDGQDARRAVRQLCEALLRDNRSLQARECVLAGKAVLERPDELLFEVYAKMPVINREDIYTHAGTFDSSLNQISACFAGQLTDWTWTDERHGNVNPWAAALYLRLSESVTQDAELECFLGQAAYHCMRDILEGGTCPVPWAIGRYCLLESQKNPVRYARLVEGIFKEKMTLYQLLNNPSSQTAEALFQLHISLAHLYASGIPQGPKPWNTWRYHVEKASDFWRKLYPGKPLDQEFSRLLPEQRCADMRVRTTAQLEQCIQQCAPKLGGVPTGKPESQCVEACRTEERAARQGNCWEDQAP